MADFTPTTASQAMVAKVLSTAAGNALSKRAGYTYINGTLAPNALSEVPARAMRAGRIVRPGTAMTEQFTSAIDPRKVLNVTVQLQTNIGLTTRTIMDDSGAGTAGNDGLLNLKPKLVPSTTPFNIPIRQREDQPLFFPQMQMDMMLFDELVETTANYYDNVTNSMDAYHIAKAVSYAVMRGARKASDKTDASTYPNLITLSEAEAYDENKMIKVINKLNAKLASGDIETQAMTFNGPRTLVARPELIGFIKTPKTGFVLNSDISTRMLYEPNFDIKEALRYGSQYRGNIAGGYELQEAPDGIWKYVEAWLGLNVGELDKVWGIVFTPMAYAAGGVAKKEMKTLQSTEYDGIVAFPNIKYGGAAYRIMYMIVDPTWAIPAKLQNPDYPAPVVAPYSWQATEPVEKTIYDASGVPIGVVPVVDIAKPNGFLSTNVTLTVLGTANAAIDNATLSVTNSGKAVGYANNADGTYSIMVPKDSAPSITISATGYTPQTFSLTPANTKKDTYMVTKTLVTT